MIVPTSLNGANRTFSRSKFVELRRRVLRRGSWFRILRRIDRATIDLSIGCAKITRSAALTRNVDEIAEKAVGLALYLGNKEVLKWKNEIGFVRYLIRCSFGFRYWS